MMDELLYWRPREAFPVGDAWISSGIEDYVDSGIKESLAAGHSVTILVIGYDLPNLTRPGYKGWRRLLSEWLEGGAVVEYLALEQRERVEKSLEESRELLQELVSGKGNGTLKIFIPNDSPKANEETRLSLSMLRNDYNTCHFLLAIDNDDEKTSQMWVEGEHLPGATMASDCYHLGPNVAFKSPQFVQNRINFEFLKKNSSCALFKE